jgi:isoamylase
MSDDDWEAGFGRSIAVYLNGQGIPGLDARGQRVTDDSFVMCFNGHDAAIEFTLPPAEFGAAWTPVVNTADQAPPPGEPKPVAAGAKMQVEARTMVVLQAVPE